MRLSGVTKSSIFEPILDHDEEMRRSMSRGRRAAYPNRDSMTSVLTSPGGQREVFSPEKLKISSGNAMGRKGDTLKAMIANKLDKKMTKGKEMESNIF